MQFRNYINSLFGKVRTFAKFGTWKEIGTFNSRFTSFGTDIYADELVRSSVRAIAEHTSKANVKAVRRTSSGRLQGDKALERIIQYRPNMYMNGKAFLYKVRTRLELDNNAFVFIQRDDVGRCTGLYPVPKATFQALSVEDELFIQFEFTNGNKITLPWADLAIIRKDYNSSDIFGDDNAPILNTLELISTANQGMSNAIKSTANLRGILKSTKAMLDPEDVKKQKEKFVTDYLNLENEGGIASIDATQDFTPITMQPQIANYKHVEELRNNVYRYFGVNDDILMSKAIGDTWEAFYEARIEPFLIDLGLELTNKIFTGREKGFGNEIIFEANRLQYTSTQNKLNLVALVDRGAMTPNEWREVFNMAPVNGGDVPIRRLDTAPTTQAKEDDTNADNEGQGVQTTPDTTAGSAEEN